ncbi:MAG: PspC domain-containing protein [Anaerolineae bacterium]|nr:PspC domain-containing protein [Anaerolineae bacterium]NUQ03123.1 PspC domain-containing protein [Anaerolineae bacterium]
MRRSFSDRILGGVCGGLAASLHVDSWLVRVAFVLLTTISQGIFAALYILFWWIVPLDSPLERRRGLPLILTLALLVLGAAAWYVRDANLLAAPDGTSMFWQAAALLLSVVFLLRQIR